MNFQTPAEVAAAVCTTGKVKAEMPIMKMVLLGILAGVYIGFGANLATRVASASQGTGLDIFLFGAVFSVGLMMVVIGGAELFTGNNLFCAGAVMHGQTSMGLLLLNWTVVFFTNFLGSLLLVYIIFNANYWGDASALTAQGAQAVAIAKGKMSLDWYQAFLRGILCNWLVCMAVWLAVAAKDVIGKIFSCFFPIMAFVSSGFEHSIANMFFIPMGIHIAQAAPEAAAAAEKVGMASAGDVVSFFTYGNFIMSNLIPVTLGNIFAGAVFVGGFYWFVYLRK